MVNPDVLQITYQALWLVLFLAGPPVLVAALVGILIAFLQAATQLQEQTLQFAAKFLAVIVTIFITASILGGELFRYTERVFTEFPWLVIG